MCCRSGFAQIAGQWKHCDSQRCGLGHCPRSLGSFRAGGPKVTAGKLEGPVLNFKLHWLSDRKQPKSGGKGSSLAAYNEKGHLESIHLTFRGLFCALFEKLWPYLRSTEGFLPLLPERTIDFLGPTWHTWGGHWMEILQSGATELG